MKYASSEVAKIGHTVSNTLKYLNWIIRALGKPIRVRTVKRIENIWLPILQYLKQRRQSQTAVGCAAQSWFRCVDRAFRVPPFGNWWMGWRFTTSFWAEKSRIPLSDFLLGMPLCGRRVFSCKSSGQVDPMWSWQTGSCQRELFQYSTVLPFTS